MRKFILLMIIMAVSAGPISATFAQEGTPAPIDIEAIQEQVESGVSCAWPVEVALDALNVAYPDENASYFVMPYLLPPGQSLIVEGAYPFARFSSLTTYYGAGAAGQGIQLLGWLRDVEIAPDPGSVNPVADPAAPEDPAQRQWTVTITGTAGVDDATSVATAAPGENVIAAHPAGGENRPGILVLRVYVPRDPADRTGGVGLPSLTLRDANGESQVLPECTAQEELIWGELIRQKVLVNVMAADRLPLPPGPDVAPAWVESPVPGLAPNPDNRYLMAPVAWEPGRIVVVRGKAPTFPDSRA